MPHGIRPPGDSHSASAQRESVSAQFRPCHLEAEPLQAVAKWVEGYERFWGRNLDSLGAYLTKVQRKSAPKKS